MRSSIDTFHDVEGAVNATASTAHEVCGRNSQTEQTSLSDKSFILAEEDISCVDRYCLNNIIIIVRLWLCRFVIIVCTHP